MEHKNISSPLRALNDPKNHKSKTIIHSQHHFTRYQTEVYSYTHTHTRIYVLGLAFCGPTPIWNY